MNTPSPDPTEELLTPWLLAYDFAIAEDSGQDSDPIPPDLTVHVEQVKSCLRLLEHVWPRSRPRASTRLDLEGTVTTPGDAARPTRSPRLPEVPGFDILGEIARGGMGVVYKARQQSLDRVVAIKCLPPAFAQDPNRLGRFRREARAAGRLVNKGILPIYDVLEAGGMPLLVMPYIDGSDLARILADRLAVQQGQRLQTRHPWATLTDAEYLARILAIFDKAVEALALLHRTEVIHRDIKPSNILVDRDGHAWLSDFGLARLGEQDGLTVAGQGLGTPGYMSPEQWDGSAAVDERADVFSMGVTIYQALALALPYGRERLASDARLPQPPSRRQPLLPASVEAVVLRALAPNQRDRYTSTGELLEDWTRARSGLPTRRGRPSEWPRRWRRGWPFAAAVAGILILGSVLAWGLNHATQPRPQPPFHQTVRVRSKPAGADVVLVPLDPNTGEPDVKRAVRADHGEKTPVELQVEPGMYLVEVQVAGGRFQQALRQAPGRNESSNTLALQHRWQLLPNGAVEWPSIKIPAADVTGAMARLPGGKFIMGHLGEPSETPHEVQVRPYYLDTREVTIAEYRRVLGHLPRGFNPEHAHQDSDPVCYVSYDEAVSFAELAGKRLPTEAEYEYAATNHGQTRYPWGNDTAPLDGLWTFQAAGEPNWDHTRDKPKPIYGLFSNLAEWTSSWPTPYPADAARWPLAPELIRTLRIVRGGPKGVTNRQQPTTHQRHYGPSYRQSWPAGEGTVRPGIGFRCARSAAPEYLHP